MPHFQGTTHAVYKLIEVVNGLFGRVELEICSPYLKLASTKSSIVILLNNTQLILQYLTRFVKHLLKRPKYIFRLALFS